MKASIGFIMAALLSAFAAVGAEQKIELSATKDTFGRSNKRNSNSGGSDYLLLAPSPGVISLVGFDLSSVTNEIVSAELSFRVFENNSTPASLMVATMVSHEDNEKWIEGIGNLGALGQNARLGEATFQWRAFRDKPWKTEGGEGQANLMEPKLWKAPVMKRSQVEWVAGDWVKLPIPDISILEAFRNSKGQVITFGMRGTAGHGVYKVNSKESGTPALLILKTKEKRRSLKREKVSGD